jgi:hypothetical protein
VFVVADRRTARAVDRGQPESVPARGVLRVAAVVSLVLVVLLISLGFGRGSGPSSQPLGRFDRVVVVSVPGLRWQDLVATDTPALDRYLGSAGLMSVRAIGPETSTLEGYLSIGAGNRIEAEVGDAPAGSVDLAELVDGRCIPGVLAAAARSADDDLNGAVAGALGEVVRGAGMQTTVHGSPAAIAALMGRDGCVDAYDDEVPVSIGPGVTLVELAGLERTDVAAERTEALGRIDAVLRSMEVPEDVLAILVAPSAPFDRAAVTVVGVRDGRPGVSDGSPASLVSPTTRRADYVTLSDLAPAVLAAVGLEVPDSMNGTEIRRTASADEDPGAQQHRLADLAERVELRDRAVGPVSVVLVVLIVLCGAAALGRRSRLARMLAPIVVAYPTITFAMGLVAYHQLPLNFVVVMVPVTSAVLAAFTVSTTSRFGAWAPVGALAVLLWVVLVIDIVSGGHLQINTPLGYTPTIAGRFQGFGNLAFGLFAAASVTTAVVAVHAIGRDRRVEDATPGSTGAGQALMEDGAGRTEPARSSWPVAWTAGAVGAITTVAIAAPGFGSDVGGTLAIVPTFAVVVSMLAGRRVGWRPLAAVGVVSVAIVGSLAALDMSRPAASRTHLGRFLDDLLHGDGGLIIRRKLRANLAILTSSFWSLILIGVLVAVAVGAWRRRDAARAALQQRPALRVFLAGVGCAGLLGFALNDSGLAVPSIMAAVVVPWLVATLVPVVKRAGR